MSRLAFQAIKGGRGEEQALCTCHQCNAQITISTQHGDSARFNTTRNGKPGKPTMTIKSERAVVETLHREGWSYIKRKLRCDTCTTQFRKKDEPEVTKATPIADTAPRSPDREMRRLIRSMLDDVYDTVHGRYIGRESDETVAAAIGQGCMWGWVSQERIEGYGDSAGNEDTDSAELSIEAAIIDAREELARITAMRDDMAQRYVGMMASVKEAGDTLQSSLRSLEKLRQDVAALKPRAGRR